MCVCVCVCVCVREREGRWIVEMKQIILFVLIFPFKLIISNCYQ